MSVRLTAKTKLLLQERSRLIAATKWHDADCRCKPCEKLVAVLDELARREKQPRREISTVYY